MSVLLTSALVATGVLLGRFLARGVGKKAGEHEAQPPPPKTEAKAPKVVPAVKAEATAMDWSAFPCGLGDVVMRAGGDEAWLAGALVLSEDRPAAVLFVAPDAGGDRFLYVKPAPASSIAWLAPLASGAVTVGAEPPSTLEHDGVRFDRVRRLPLSVSRKGSGAPDVGDSAIIAEYTCSTGDVLLVVRSESSTRAFRGSELMPGTFDVLPGERDVS